MLRPGSVGASQLRDNSVSAAHIVDGAVSASHLTDAVQISLEKADSAYQRPAGGVPLTDLDRADLDAAYAPKVSATGSYTYDANGNVTGTPDGTTYTWESDGAGSFRVKTETVGTITRTFTYNTDGTLGSVA